MDADREWWLRVPAVLLSPRSVFAALREESTEDLDARAEPVLALVCLAGIAAALGTSTAGTLFDNPEYDALLVAVWAVVAGGFVAFTGYFVIGAAVRTRARTGNSSTPSSSGSPPGRRYSCSSEYAPSTAGAGGARSPRSASSRSS